MIPQQHEQTVHNAAATLSGFDTRSIDSAPARCRQRARGVLQRRWPHPEWLQEPLQRLPRQLQHIVQAVITFNDSAESPCTSAVTAYSAHCSAIHEASQCARTTLLRGTVVLYDEFVEPPPSWASKSSSMPALPEAARGCPCSSACPAPSTEERPMMRRAVSRAACASADSVLPCAIAGRIIIQQDDVCRWRRLSTTRALLSSSAQPSDEHPPICA